MLLGKVVFKPSAGWPLARPGSLVQWRIRVKDKTLRAEVEGATRCGQESREEL